jgi:hypothetical protein
MLHLGEPTAGPLVELPPPIVCTRGASKMAELSFGGIPERWVDTDGYIRLAAGAARAHWIYEHRWLLERFLGGPLPLLAHVHHRNRRRADNRLANLLLLPNPLVHRVLHERLARGAASEVRALEEACLAWTARLREHYRRCTASAPPVFTGDWERRPVLEVAPARPGRRRFIVRPRLD